MKNKIIEFVNGSKIKFIDAESGVIRGKRSSIISTPCGYQMTLDCNCQTCLRGDCDWNINKGEW